MGPLKLVEAAPEGASRKYAKKDTLGRPTTWEGGAITYAEDGSALYIIRKMIGGQRIEARLKPHENPIVELGRFLEDPLGYRDARKQSAAPPPRISLKPPIILNADLIGELEAWLKVNSLKPGRKGGCDANYISSRCNDLEVGWMAYFLGADMRPASIEEAYAMARDARVFIDGKDKKHPNERSARTMTDAIRALGAYLERKVTWREEENWTRKLPTIKSGSRKDKGAEPYSREYLEELYRRTDCQHYRDVLRLQACFAFHYSELLGIHQGDGLKRLKKITDSPPIGGLVQFWHKNQKWHGIYVDAAGFAALERITKLEILPDERSAKRYWRRKCGYIIDRKQRTTPDPECKNRLELFAGTHLFRHTFNSAGDDAQAFFFKGKVGVPQQLLAEVGGHSLEVNARYNLKDGPKSLVIMPWKLEHPDDPPLKD